MVDAGRLDLASFELKEIYSEVESILEDGSALLIVSEEEGNLSFRLFKCPLPLAVDLKRENPALEKSDLGHEAGEAKDVEAELEADQITEPEVEEEPDTLEEMERENEEEEEPLGSTEDTYSE